MIRFAIVSMGRSGSTFLERMLKSHPNITCFGEIISCNSKYGRDLSGQYIGEYLETMYGDALTVGFKMPWDFLIHYPDVWGEFRARGYRIVFLRRNNKVDQFLSMKLAQLNNLWGSNAIYAHQSITVDPTEMSDFVKNAIYVDSVLRSMCSRFPMIEVTYEDLTDGEGWESMQDFLGAVHEPFKAGTLRSRTKPRWEVISNFRDLLAAFPSGPVRAFLTAPESVAA